MIWEFLLAGFEFIPIRPTTSSRIIPAALFLVSFIGTLHLDISILFCDLFIVI